MGYPVRIKPGSCIAWDGREFGMSITVAIGTATESTAPMLPLVPFSYRISVVILVCSLH